MNGFKRTYQVPFNNSIPNYIETHLDNISLFSRYIKFLRRVLYLFLKGQSGLEIFKILPEHNRILWINISAPSLGDSLMDLSSRILLKDKDLDLFTNEKNSHIYSEDMFFNKVYTNENQLNNFEYDLVIIDSFSSRSIKIQGIYKEQTYKIYNLIGAEVLRGSINFNENIEIHNCHLN